jgi:hypothetical protein
VAEGEADRDTIHHNVRTLSRSLASSSFAQQAGMSLHDLITKECHAPPVDKKSVKSKQYSLPTIASQIILETAVKMFDMTRHFEASLEHQMALRLHLPLRARRSPWYDDARPFCSC